jgi:hypothetical protein
MRINGIAPPPRPARFRSTMPPGWNRVSVRGDHAHVEITTQTDAPAEGVVIDTSFGLPSSAAELIRARDASFPVHDGDVTAVEHHVTW